MKLSRDEERFLHRWIHDEARYEQEPGPAKRMQLQHGATPANLSMIIAAAIPDPAEQERIASGAPPDEPLTWPWTDSELQQRVAEARSTLERAGKHDESKRPWMQLIGMFHGQPNDSTSVDAVVYGRDKP